MAKSFRQIISENEIFKTFIWFYSVGLLLFILPFTRPVFVHITWLTLLLVFAIVFSFHKTWNTKTILYFTFIIIASFFYEKMGVATGKIFGDYRYLQALGPKLYGTPLIIGINWLFLSYASHDIASKLFSKPLPKILTASLLMLSYDMIMEWAAQPMQMWTFDSHYPPLSNFTAWFFAAVVFQCGFELLRLRSDNKPARMLFVIQMVFFVFISIYATLFIK